MLHWRPTELSGSTHIVTELQRLQSVTALDQVLGEIAAMHWEHAAVHVQMEALHAQTEVQNHLLHLLLAWSGARAPSPPPYSFSSIGLHKLAAEDDA